MKSIEQNKEKEEEKAEEPTLQKDADTSIVEVEKPIYLTATQRNLLNAWESISLLKEEQLWNRYYGLERENRKKLGVFKIDFSDWSLIMHPKIEQDAPSGYSEIMQKIMDAFKNKKYVIVCVSGNSDSVHKFKIELEKELEKLSFYTIIIDNPIGEYPEKCIGIITEYVF